MTEEQAIPTSQTPARTRQDIGVLIQDELSIAGITEESFKALKEEAQALVPMEVSSDADAQELQKVITKGVRMCSTISATIEPGKKWAHQLHKAYTSNENEFLGTVKAIIEPLKQKKEAWVARKEQAEREELERKEAAIRARLAAIEQFDFTRRTGTDGREDFYTNGITNIEMSAITMSDEQAWQNLLSSLRMVWEEAQAAKAEKQRIAAEEAERIRLAQEELAEQQRKLKEQQDAFNAQVNAARANELVAIGMLREPNGDQVYLSEDQRGYRYPVAQLYDFAGWDDEIRMLKGLVAERDADIVKRQEAVQRERLRTFRYGKMTTSGFTSEADNDGLPAVFTMHFDSKPFSITHDECYALSDEDFNALLHRAFLEKNRRREAEIQAAKEQAVKQEKERIIQEAKEAREKEEERQRKMNDAQRWEEWVKTVERNAPKMASEIGKHAITRVIEGMKKMTPGIINDLNK